MNLAVGFFCPICGHEQANLLGIDRDERGVVVGLRFVCATCECVFREGTVTNEPETFRVVLNTGRGGR